MNLSGKTAGIHHGAEQGAPKLRLAAWCLYDWGNSAFPAIVLSFSFAPYFAEHVAPDILSGTALWGRTMSASAIVIAVLSPIAGAICDKAGARKRWLAACSMLAIVATALLWLIEPEVEDVAAALILVAVANVGFELGYVFYNGMLPNIVPYAMIGRASGWGWGAGYFGSLACMASVWVLLVRDTPSFEFGRSAFEHIRVSAPFAAAWFAVFILPLFLIVPDRPRSELLLVQVIRGGLKEVAMTLRTLRQHRDVGWYLLAHLIYMDGLNTLFVFGPIYAAGTMSMTESEILVFGIGFFVAAGIGSIVFAWLDDWLGSRLVIILSLVALIVLCSGLFLITSKEVFLLLAWGLALFVGPTQSASRTLMAHLAPKGMENQMFGLYSLAGRASAPVSPLLVGLVTTAAGSQRAGIAVMLVSLVVGLALLLKVRERDAAAHQT